MTPVTSSALLLRADEQEVILDALLRYVEAEAIDGDLDRARIADRLRVDIRKGGAIRGIREIPS